MSHDGQAYPCGSGDIELWGGIECTVNRVGDVCFDQLKRGGHYVRSDDINLIADLGFKAVRFPILWEHAQPGPEGIDLSWSSDRVKQLINRQIRVIAGLVHHGSGPCWTSLIDDQFPEKLATFAAEVARSYPEISDFTPINEPLTTARFSGLYGHWYPHTRSDHVFVRILLLECRATLRAMQEIRKFVPHARLIQTEDLAYIHSTKKLRYQAEFENERRWLSFDLITGRVDKNHPLWKYLLNAGATKEELLWFRDQDAGEVMLGLNYYLTSERFLDHRVDSYPDLYRGSNNRDIYVDVEAIRIPSLSKLGIQHRLVETNDRYHLPIAITECHLGCHRESQLQWLHETWNAANMAKAEGVDIRAVTSWSLFGAYNWNTLVTAEQNHYEVGAFDVRSCPPRPTAISSALRMISEQGSLTHPVLSGDPWWKRDDRFLRMHQRPPLECLDSRIHRQKSRPLFIWGSERILGRSFVKRCAKRHLHFVAFDSRKYRPDQLFDFFRERSETNPWAAIDCTRGRISWRRKLMSDCSEIDESIFPLVAACRSFDIPLLIFSSDHVFDGNKPSPYLEGDDVSPLSFRGIMDSQIEQSILKSYPNSLIIRTSALFDSTDLRHVLARLLFAAHEGRTVSVADDWIVSPTFIPDLVDCCLDLLIDGTTGLWHLANNGELSWKAFAHLVARSAGISARRLAGCSGSRFCKDLSFPRRSSLSSERGLLLPELELSIARFGHEFRPQDLRVVRKRTSTLGESVSARE
ncbi:sugar nucleotide-binding protein [bacterium]|nr:sugar nucleotide-binding protein [bacterium]